MKPVPQCLIYLVSRHSASIVSAYVLRSAGWSIHALVNYHTCDDELFRSCKKCLSQLSIFARMRQEAVVHPLREETRAPEKHPQPRLSI
jgi:hypothetical protein